MEQIYQIDGISLTVHMPAELDHQHIIFDFRNTDFMDSSGIGLVAGRYRLLNLRGGSVEAVHVNDRIDKILHLSGMHKIIEIHREEEKDGD